MPTSKIPIPSSLDEMRHIMAGFLKTADGGQFWDLITALRGPDSPSETPNMTPDLSAKMYKGRRERKFKTVEVLRHHAFYGTIGGAARSHADDKVILPPEGEWDHFDKHVSRAAKVLGLKVEIETLPEVKGCEVKMGKLSESLEKANATKKSSCKVPAAAPGTFTITIGANQQLKPITPHMQSFFNYYAGNSTAQKSIINKWTHMDYDVSSLNK